MKHFYIPHRIAFILLFVCSFTAIAQVSKNCNFSQLQYQYTDTTINSITYRTYYADGLTLTETPGAPMIPCRIYKFSVPYNATNISIVSNKNITQYSQLHNCTLMPAMYPKAMCDTTPDQIQADSTIFNTNAYYPNKVAEITGEGLYMGENHIVTVAVYPMQFNPVTAMLKLNQSISFTITYNICNDSISRALVCDDLALRQKSWDKAKIIVENPSQVEGFAPNETAVHYIQMHYIPDSLQTHLNDSTAHYGGELFTPTCEYMIVTTPDLAPSFHRLVALKRQKGYTVGVKCIDGIISSPLVQFGDRVIKTDGTYSCINDSAGKLRHYLRLAYTMDKTRYVLLGGRNVPFRYGCLSDTITNPQTIMNKNTPTDMYFTDLNSNWNIDGDNYYGEPEELDYGRKLDAFPELFVGRLMADSINQIDNYTNKLIQYELNPGRGDTGYLKRVLVTDGMKPGKYDGLTSFLSQKYGSVFSDVTLIPITSNPTAASIINNINANKYGVINIFGHGTPHNINVNSTDSFPTGSFLRSLQIMANKPHELGLDMLDNKYHPCIIYSESCTNMPYDIYVYYLNNWIYNKTNLGQSFTLGKDYGGVAYIGNTRSGYAGVSNNLPYYNTQLERLFIDCLQNGVTKVGIAEAMSRQEYCHNSKDRIIMPAFTHNLMGEPEFYIWTDEPTLYNGITVSRSDNSIVVSGISADSTIVAICDNDGNAIRKYSANGSATFTNISPNSTIMLYKHNYLPYIAPQYIQNTDIENSQYVFASEVYIGRDVDNNRTIGDVIIPSGVNYEMEFTHNINISGGFDIEQGATFIVTPSDY